MLDPIKLYNVRKKDADYCRLEDISPTFVKLIVLSEDVPFYKHRGFNRTMLKRSLKANIKRRRMLFGGSTITQQLAKNLYFSFRKSILRKLLESFVTLWIEKKFSKQQILEFYLNMIYFGNGQYGITHAAQFYYAESPSELNLLQSINLITVVTGPTYLNPLVHPDHFVERRDRMLAHLKVMKAIDDDYIRFVQNEYPTDKVIDLFPAAGEPLLDGRVPMKNALAQELRARGKK